MIKSLDILGHKVRIKYVSSWNGHKDIPSGLIGRFYPDTGTIYILKTKPKEMQKHFLLHEINHAIMFYTGIGQSISLELEEVIAQSFASFYKGFIK